MDNTLLHILAIVWIHFVSDFCFQSREVAANKSKDVKVLARHVLEYSVCFLVMGVWLPIMAVIWFAMVNFALHFATDFISSKLSSRMYVAGNMERFWDVIGIDQAVHITCLLTTYYWLFQ